ncbi:MAG: helix-turn-helix domain-containing protein [Crocinitomicaceae bacterium]
MQELMISQFTKTDLENAINEAFKIHVESKFNQLINNQEKGKDFLTRKETSEFFSVSIVTIHNWVKEGIISSYKLGNRTYFKRSELVEQLLNSKTVA